MARYFFQILFCTLLSISSFAQKTQIIFEQQYTNKFGDWIRCMYQDSRGFLWIGTVNELKRFDGYDVVSFEPKPGDTTTISGNYIQCIREDHTDMLWIGTLSNGLNMYNPNTNKFKRFLHDENDRFSLSSNRVNYIYEDKEQDLWIGAEDCLKKFDRNSKRFIGYRQDRKWITHITEDENGLLWISTWEGLFLFDKSEECFIPFGEYFQIDDVFKNKSVLICYRDSSNNFWIGTDGLYQFIRQSKALNYYPIKSSFNYAVYSHNVTAIWEEGDFLWVGKRDGLYQFNKKEKTYIQHVQDPDNHQSIIENDIITILRDKSGSYWLSGWSKGISKRNSIREGVKFYLPNPFNGKSIKDKITALFQSKSGIIWIGTAANGFFSFEKNNQIFKGYHHDAKDLNSLSHNNVRCIIENRNGFLWIGTYYGLNKFNPRTNKYFLYTYDPENQNSLSHNRVQSLLESSDGSIYVGTSGGFNHFDPLTEKFTRYVNNPDDPHSISNNFIPTIYEDSGNDIWIGTRGGGLNRFDPTRRQFIHYKSDLANPYSISSNTVYSIYEFPYKNRPTLWIGTHGGGLCRFDMETERFFTISEKDGLTNNEVRGIISDVKGNLWLATEEQITRYNPNTKTIKNYEISAEMPVNPYTCLIDSDGEIFFGGLRGMIRFFADSLKDNPYYPPIVITKLRVNNQPIQLDTVITEKKRIALSYDHNNLNFEFAALDFNRPEMNQYAYKMEGLDKDWVYTDASRRYAAYTYIDPGEYVFRVKGSNNDGLWNEEGRFVEIIIRPPWWKTSWAYGFYLFVTLSVIYGIYRFQTNRLKLRHQLEIEYLHTEKLEEIDQAKSRFFANISHEFRTPLTLILGPVEQMLSDSFRGNLKEQYKMILRNGRKLLRLINQLLDLSRLESGAMNLSVRKYNMVKLVKNFIQNFESLAKRKNIHLGFYSEKDTISLYVDKDKIEKIIDNLLSNAFKYTSEGGKISVQLHVENKFTPKSNMVENDPDIFLKSKNGEWLKISISDDGIGMSADCLNKIFDRFYQIENTQSCEYEGSGIGLALSRELVELHHGILKAESEIGKGSTFFIYLPFGKEHFSKDEMNVTEDPSLITDKTVVGEISEDITLQVTPETDFKYTDNKNSGLPVLLIVEDNIDMRSYLNGHLASEFRIIEAINGQDGLKKAIQEIPDIIISDIMMSKMDGFELCHKIKTDMRTSHIPLILLTARAESTHKIEGLETGADDYMVKPFVAEELKARSKNLIDQRYKLKEKFSREINFPFNKLTTNRTDNFFTKNLMKIVNENLSEFGFNIEDLSEKLGMSRMTLHRKIQGLFGQSPGNFLRTIRLKRGAELLKDKSKNISEIAYEVGFESPNTFSKNFRRQFGISPSIFIKQSHL